MPTFLLLITFNLPFIIKFFCFKYVYITKTKIITKKNKLK